MFISYTILTVKHNLKYPQPSAQRSMIQIMDSHGIGVKHHI